MMVSRSTILITGALGCIGRATVNWLLDNCDAGLVLFSRSLRDEDVAAAFPGNHGGRLIVERGDVTDPARIVSLFRDHTITHVVHLAGLQTPDCNAHRDLGLQVNLAGTQHLIEAIKSLPDPRTVLAFVYASSVAVYGPRDNYAEDKITPESLVDPVNVYGIWKYASELIAKLFHADTGIPTICIRPATLFGPGRDLGQTAAPTTALKSVAIGVPYTIPFDSRLDYQYAPDVGAAFGMCALQPPPGFHVFNLPSVTLAMSEVVDSMRRGATEVGVFDRFHVAIGEESVPFIYDLGFQSFLDLFPNIQQTPLDDAVRKSIEVFIHQAERGVLRAGDLS